jgi:hypothetical protein
VNLTMIYYKNFCKCHNVLLTINNKKLDISTMS